MPLEKIKISAEDIQATEAYQNAGNVVQSMYATPLYVSAVSGWLTVCKYKGLEHMLNVFHMDDFRKSLIKELWKIKKDQNG